MKTECEEDDVILEKTPESITFNIPSSAVEELRCSECKEYLSREPIYTLPNGSSICGQCLQVTSLQVVRAIHFERHLHYITFPCFFKQFGCTERVRFGQAIDHESVCIYRIPLCPCKDCMWTGSVSNIKSHLIKEHADIFKDKAIFKIQVDKNTQEVFLLKKGNSVFVIKYLYDASHGNLKYDIRYCINTFVDSASFKLRLINDSDVECNMNLKRTNCVSYNFNFHDIKNAYTLNIIKLLEFLGGPACTAVTAELFFTCSMNDELLKTLKCQVCTRYLIPPLHKWNNNTVCSDCTATCTNCQPLKDDKLLHLVTEVELPCRWEECEFSEKCETLRKHESECRFKVYNCLICLSVEKLKTTEAIDHYKKKHPGVQYMLEKISLKININTSVDLRVIANKNNMLILCVFYKNASRDRLHLILRSFRTDINYYGTVNIEHQHCTLKPKPFKIYRGKGLQIDLNALPSCFKEIDPNLTVIVDFH